jgi:putative transposase
VEAHGVKVSMDGRGRWIDNVFIERFWRSIKYECVYLHAFESVRDARRKIGEYMGYYNQRKHSSLGRQSPDRVYNQVVGVRLVPAAVHRKSGALTASPCS